MRETVSLDRPKKENLLARIKKCIDNDNYIITNHAIKRQDERSIVLADILYVLRNGFHEEDKTLFNVKYQSWNYAIRGTTTDGTNLRIIIGFEEKMVVITVIKIVKGESRKR